MGELARKACKYKIEVSKVKAHLIGGQSEQSDESYNREKRRIGAQKNRKNRRIGKIGESENSNRMNRIIGKIGRSEESYNRKKRRIGE